jgi:guanine deaminase
LIASQAAQQTGRENLSIEEALYLATRGGAQVVDMADHIGGFEEGMLWDTQLIELGGVVDGEPDEGAGNIDVFGWESWEEKIAKWVWNGDDRNVRAVWVNGKLVHARK